MAKGVKLASEVIPGHFKASPLNPEMHGGGRRVSDGSDSWSDGVRVGMSLSVRDDSHWKSCIEGEVSLGESFSGFDCRSAQLIQFA